MINDSDGRGAYVVEAPGESALLPPLQLSHVEPENMAIIKRYGMVYDLER